MSASLRHERFKQYVETAPTTEMMRASHHARQESGSPIPPMQRYLISK